MTANAHPPRPLARPAARARAFATGQPGDSQPYPSTEPGDPIRATLTERVTAVLKPVGTGKGSNAFEKDLLVVVSLVCVNAITACPS